MKKIAAVWFVCFMLALVGASATTTTLISPTSSSIVRSTSVFNATIDSAVNSNLVNCSYYAYSASTANSSAVLLMYNETTFADNITMGRPRKVVDTGSSWNFNLEDASDYVVYASCYNGSAWVNSASATGVTIDLTKPGTPTTTETQQKIKSTKSISYTVVGTNTTGCTFYLGTVLNPTQNSYTMTHSGNTCTYSISKSLYIPDGTYQMYAVATDGLNTSTSSTTEGISLDFTNRNSAAGQQVIQQAAQQEQAKNNKNLLLIAGGIILAIILFGKKGKR